MLTAAIWWCLSVCTVDPQHPRLIRTKLGVVLMKNLLTLTRDICLIGHEPSGAAGMCISHFPNSSFLKGCEILFQSSATLRWSKIKEINDIFCTIKIYCPWNMWTFYKWPFRDLKIIYQLYSIIFSEEGTSTVSAFFLDD